MNWTFTTGMAIGLAIAYAHAIYLLHKAGHRLRKWVDRNTHLGNGLGG